MGIVMGVVALPFRAVALVLKVILLVGGLFGLVVKLALGVAILGVLAIAGLEWIGVDLVGSIGGGRP